MMEQERSFAEIRMTRDLVIKLIRRSWREVPILLNFQCMESIILKVKDLSQEDHIQDCQIIRQPLKNSEKRMKDASCSVRLEIGGEKNTRDRR